MGWPGDMFSESDVSGTWSFSVQKTWSKSLLPGWDCHLIWEMPNRNPTVHQALGTESKGVTLLKFY